MLTPADINGSPGDFDIHSVDIQLPLTEDATEVSSLPPYISEDTGIPDASIVGAEESFSNGGTGNEVECTSAIHELDPFESNIASGMYL